MVTKISVAETESLRTQHQRHVQEKQHLLNQLTAQYHAIQKTVQQRKTQAIAQFEANLTSVQKGIAKQAQRNRECREQQAAIEAAEFHSLLREGANPYAVFRRRREELKAKQAAAKLSADIDHKKAAIHQQVQRERQLQHQEAQTQLLHQQALARYREQRTVAAERNVDKFIMEHVREGLTMIDPTGRTTLHPSQVAKVGYRRE